MSAAVICPACDTVVYPDCVILADHHIGYTYWGLRAKWTHPTFGVVHICDPARRERVYAADRLHVALPPWARFLHRHALTRPLARRWYGHRQFCAILHLAAATETRP